MILTVKDTEKEESVSVAERFIRLGYEIYATKGTAKFLKSKGIDVIGVNKT